MAEWPSSPGYLSPILPLTPLPASLHISQRAECQAYCWWQPITTHVRAGSLDPALTYKWPSGEKPAAETLPGCCVLTTVLRPLICNLCSQTEVLEALMSMQHTERNNYSCGRWVFSRAL